HLVSPLIASEDYAPEFFIRDEVRAWAQKQWEALALPSGRRKIGLFFGGNPDRPERLWPVAHWTALARQVQADPRLSLVAVVPPRNLLSGSRAAESGIFNQVLPHLQAKPAVFSHAQLECVAAFLQGLDLFVCVDGGLFHAATA